MRGLKKMMGFSLLVVSSVHAAKFETTSPSRVIADQFIMSFSGGAAWGLSGDAHTFNLDPNVCRTFTASDSNQPMAIGEFFIGEQRALTPRFQGALGLAFGITSGLKRTGDIWEQANPNFDHYTYEYSIKHQYISVKGKLLGEPLRYSLSPYGTLSLGLGFNEASDYRSTPKIEEASELLPFKKHTHRSFTYALGVGLQSALNSTWSVGVGYEFADIGKNQLGPADDQTFNRGISLNHLYTNSALISLTYLG